MKEFDFEKTPIVEIANEILLDGVKRGASDIHFDPYKDGLAIRMRVDGILYDYSTVPANYKRNMISRIKMIASMNIMETRLPQDGAIKSKIGDKTLDLRVSSLPTHNGEKVVLRILDYSKSLQGLETLGFSEYNLQKIISMIEIPNGIVLVTGATGSGKSTTVYSILQKLNTREVNIITVEDPVEMEIEGLNQVQAQQEIGLDFATVLRSILRQDPDIIMIGEIRDTETARIAVRASITGHKVLSTIHTNNALNTIERLTDMDVERYLIGTSLNGIISQKLARKLCPHCRIARETNEYEKSLFKTVLHKNIDKVFEVNPEGCEHCFKGYKDRIAIAEVLLITDDIRTAITEAEPKEVMRKLVYYDGHTHTLLEDGLEKIALGETNFEEIFKLVDLENDLAVAKSFYDEVEKDLNSGKTENEIITNESVKEELSQGSNVDNRNVVDVPQNTTQTYETPVDTTEQAPQGYIEQNNVTQPEEVSQVQNVVSDEVVPTPLPQEEPANEVVNEENNIEPIVTQNLTDQNTTSSEIPSNTTTMPQNIETVDNTQVIENNTLTNSYKDNINNIIEIIDDNDDNQGEEPVQVEPFDTNDVSAIETLDTNNKAVEQTPIETLDTNDVVESTPLETLDTNTNTISEVESKTSEPTDTDTQALEMFDENVNNQVPEEIEPVNTNNDIEMVPLETDEDSQVLANPIANTKVLETFDELDNKEEDNDNSNINYDQMMKVPFVDETLDL